MGSSVFLEKEFQGKYMPGPLEHPRWGAHSTFDGELLFANLLREIVELVVPNELRLAKNTKAPWLHPVALIQAHHADCWWDLPFVIPRDVDDTRAPECILDYQELILLIPFVQCAPDDRWHNYAVRMYLDNEYAIVVGNTVEVTTGAPGIPAHYGAMREIMRIPILGRAFAGPWRSRPTARRACVAPRATFPAPRGASPATTRSRRTSPAPSASSSRAAVRRRPTVDRT